MLIITTDENNNLHVINIKISIGYNVLNYFNLTM